MSSTATAAGSANAPSRARTVSVTVRYIRLNTATPSAGGSPAPIARSRRTTASIPCTAAALVDTLTIRHPPAPSVR
ncbi:hypothetical protein GCM10009639_66420 [Kitasatospora putterlickiae]|uniref:Uncharacterized protein n=1 Tax=Kitasatospora putterlickiae TaxID=221725 RepID=A0ABN1YH20_9ACTN